MTRRQHPFRMPPGYQPSDQAPLGGSAAEKRVMTHILKAFSAEIAVLQEDGMKPRAIVVGLLMSAVKLSAVSNAMSPPELRSSLEAIVERYTGEDEE
jgi:hypothetical protein